jgi:hypothetical protein
VGGLPSLVAPFRFTPAGGSRRGPGGD